MNDISRAGDPAMGAELHRRGRDLLDRAVVTFNGQAVGTVAATDPEAPALNYDQVFIRDFVPVALYYLAEGEPAMVRHFLIRCCELQATERSMDCYRPGAGLIPASFKVAADDRSLIPDYGGHAIGRVAPVDASLWWLYLLRVYVRATGDRELAARADFQAAIKRILELCLIDRFDMYPTLLVPDGSFMVDRRLGVYGFPLEVQALFYMALRAADELLTDAEDGPFYREAVAGRLGKLVHYVRAYYWLDLGVLNRLYRADTEEYGAEAFNAFNIVPESIPTWLPDWLAEGGGYLAGNLGPSRLDYRFFTQGNLLAVLSGLADGDQASAILTQIGERRDDLIADMPLKLCYPALAGDDWRTVTGSDPKNTPWSYHNGGSWPVFLWLLAAAGQHRGQPGLARTAVARAAERLPATAWAEYFDGPRGRLVGKQARRYQTWTVAGVLLADRFLAHPDILGALTFGEDVAPEQCAI
ncbi:glycoside hydrolase 100 family protein [Thiohalorhabdus sp.]|uniref:glycoside hydrolase 100 family protein n=1 Tax=Thiohalorhabdus sp. TaxID=3094134 RepID=UPI002FC3B87B